MTDQMKKNGGKRIGAGRPPTPGPNKTAWGVKLYPDELATLRGYPQARLAELLVSGLRLGAGNVTHLSDEDCDIIRATLNGTILDALTVRHLADEVEDHDHPDAPDLARRLRELGDWELLHLALTLG